MIDAVGWWVLFPSEDRPRLRSLIWMRWIGESVSNLAPSVERGATSARFQESPNGRSRPPERLAAIAAGFLEPGSGPASPGFAGRVLNPFGRAGRVN